MPRSLWTGSVSFGLVNVPVQLVSAVRDVDVHFRRLHATDHAPIETRRFCSAEDREVDYARVGHGYELDGGGQVVLTDEDLASVAPRKTRTIDIEAFVDLSEVDPILFDHPYFLLPAGDTEGALRAYRLLVEVLGSTRRAALGRFVLRSREYLAILRVRDKRLALTTMLFHDEVRPRAGVEPGGAAPPRRQLDQAVALIEELSVDWDPARYEDRHRERLLEVIGRKQQGERVRPPRQDKQPTAVPDLMAALRRSLEQARGGPPATAGDGGDGRAVRQELEGLSRSELYRRAQQEDVAGRSSMNKQQLIDALAG